MLLAAQVRYEHHLITLRAIKYVYVYTRSL